MRRFIQGGQRRLEIACLHGLVRGGKLFVQGFNRARFFGVFRLRLLHLFQLLGGNPLLLGGFRLGLLQIEVEYGLVCSDRKVADLVQLLAILSQSDLVLAGLDAQRKVLALFVRLQVVLSTVVSIRPFHVGADDWGSIHIFAGTLDCPCGLGEHRGYTQCRHRYHQHHNQQTLLHFLASRLTNLISLPSDVETL